MKVMIAGAGSVGSSIARELVANHHEVLLVDLKAEMEQRADLEGVKWLIGDACELAVLQRVQLEDYDVVVSATGDDKVNLVVSLLAKTEFAVGRVVGRVNDPRNEWLFTDAWGVDVAVSTPRILAALVEEAVSVGDLVRLFTLRQGQVNLVEVTLPPTTSIAGRPVRDLKLPRDAALVTILRGGRVIVPQPDEPLEPGDELLFVASTEVEGQVREALR